MVCERCKDKFDDLQFDQVTFLEQCSHSVCNKCMKELIFEKYPEVECPSENCHNNILDFEIHGILG